MFDADSYIAKYQETEHGAARLRAMKEAIQAADEAKCDEWRFLFRERYITESVFESDDVDAMVIFPQMLAVYDASEELQADDDNRHRLMWAFKMILENAHKFTHISLDEIYKLFEEFKRRCELYGYSPRTYYYLLEDQAEAEGRLLPESEIGRYHNYPEDDLRDCAACEAAHAVRWALLTNQRERAEALSQPIFSGEIRCAEVPENTYEAWIRYDIEKGDYHHARGFAKKLYPMLRRRMDLLDQIGTLLRLYAVIDRHTGAQIFRRELRTYLDCRNHFTKMHFAAGAYKLFAAIRMEHVSLVLPPDFALYSPGHGYETAALRDYFYQEAKQYAEAFDKRNGNTFQTDLLERTDPPFDAKAEELMQGEVDQEPSALGAVCAKLPDTLTAASAAALIEAGENGRFSVKGAQDLEEKGAIAFQLEDTETEEAYQLVVMVQPVPPLDEFRPASPVPNSLKDEVAKAEGVVVCLTTFDDKPADEALHVQIKLLHMLCPDALTYLDFSRLKVLPANWVRLTAESKVPPLVDYLYTLRLSGDAEHDAIWITTQGLKCLGLRDLEIWDATKENYKRYADLLCFAAERILIRESLCDAHTAFNVVRTADGGSLDCVWVPASQAYADYPDGNEAGLAVRRDVIGTDGEGDVNAVLFLAAGGETDGKANRKRLDTLTDADFDNLRYGTFLATSSKTADLAKERYEILQDLVQRSEEPVYACVETETESDTYEIWMQVTEAGAERISGTLAEDCAVGKEGAAYQAAVSQLVNFTGRLQGVQIHPNTAYLALEL